MMTGKFWRRTASLVLHSAVGVALLAAVAKPAHALLRDEDGNRSSVGSDITIGVNETAQNVACVGCTVYVHGTVDGNIAVVLGDVVVDGTVNDKVAVVMGDLKVLRGGVVKGDVAQVIGETEVDGGSLEGRSAHVSATPILAAMLVPVLMVVLVIWFVVWLIRRGSGPRYPFPPPPPPRT